MKINLNILIKSPDFQRVKKIIIFLHGYGANGNDFADIAQYIVEKMSNTIVLMLDAPFECSAFSYGREWFPLSDDSLMEDIENGINLIAPMLKSYIDSVKEEYYCENVVLIGFSQGAILSLSMLYYSTISKIVAFSGLFHVKNNLQIISSAEILIVHGDEDTVVPYKNAIHAIKNLTKFKLNAKLITCKGVEHTISMQYIDDCVQFLQESN